MVHLIDKDALVAEIKRRKELVSDPILLGNDLMIGERNAYFNLLSFIDTLEVKEVDLEHLEQEVKDFCYKFDDRKDKWYDMTPHDKNIMTNPTWSNFAMQLAKHFFELGIKAQKGE